MAEETVRIDFHGEELVVWRATGLVGPLGLPAALTRYSKGRATVEDVVAAFVRARIARPENYRHARDAVEELALRIADVASPQLPSGSLKELADALVGQQSQVVRRVERGREHVVDVSLAGTQGMRDAEEWLTERVARFPWLFQALMGPRLRALGMTRDEYLRTVREANARARRVNNEMRRQIERRKDETAIEFARRKAMHPQNLTLQEQLVLPGEVVRGIAQALRRLEASGVEPPASARALEGTERPSEAQVREALRDSRPLAVEHGATDAVEIIDAASAPPSEETWRRLEQTIDRSFAKHQEDAAADKRAIDRRTAILMFVLPLITLLVEYGVIKPIFEPDPPKQAAPAPTNQPPATQPPQGQQPPGPQTPQEGEAKPIPPAAPRRPEERTD